MSLVTFALENDDLKFVSNGGSNLHTINTKTYEKYINDLFGLQKYIVESDDPDSHLEIYDHQIFDNIVKKKYNMESQLFRSQDDAKKKLCSYHNDEYMKLITEFQKFKHPIMIAGSSVLAAVSHKLNFEPNDIDLYIRNIDYEKIVEFDGLIKTIYPNNKILIIRRPLTITWVVLDGDKILINLQLNTTKFKSWSNVFISYHCDFVCIGYDVSSEKIIILKHRWHHYADNYYENTICVNINSIDNEQTLISSSKKYMNRGIPTVPVYITGYKTTFVKKHVDNVHNVNSISLNMSNDENNNDNNGDEESKNDESNDIVKKMVRTYSGLIDVIFTSNICKIIDEKIDFPHIKDLKNITPVDDYIVSIINHESFDESVCPVSLDSFCVGVKNINCQHVISLKALMFGGLDKCPICREKFEPKLCFL